MPVVIVEMWQGRTEEQKEQLIKGITKAFEGLGIPSDKLHIIIHDVPKCNWGTLGGPASKTRANVNP
jgi:4-oxalocrotonate tautomerase